MLVSYDIWEVFWKVMYLQVVLCLTCLTLGNTLEPWKGQNNGYFLKSFWAKDQIYSFMYIYIHALFVYQMLWICVKYCVKRCVVYSHLYRTLPHLFNLGVCGMTPRQGLWVSRLRHTQLLSCALSQKKNHLANVVCFKTWRDGYLVVRTHTHNMWFWFNNNNINKNGESSVINWDS